MGLPYDLYRLFTVHSTLCVTLTVAFLARFLTLSTESITGATLTYSLTLCDTVLCSLLPFWCKSVSFCILPVCILLVVQLGTY